MGEGVTEQMEFYVIVVCQDDIGKGCRDMARRQKFFLERMGKAMDALASTKI